MNPRPWLLPWHGQWVPHALLDILRGCDMTCRACYNTHARQAKPLAQLRHELDILLRHRRLDSVSIVGGEPTLHPQLCDIIRMVKSAGLSVELFTNGLRLDTPFLADLKAAGTDLIFLHIDPHQHRPDLPAPAAIQSLRASKAAAVVAAGIEVGLAVTAYPDALDDIDPAIELTLTSPHIHYLLVTLCRDTHAIGSLTGDLSTGFRGTPPTRANLEAAATLTNNHIIPHLRDRFGLLPFAYLGANIDPHDPRWLSYMIATLTGGSAPSWAMLQPSAIEPLFLRLYRRLRGRFPFYLPQAPGKFRLQLFLNALTGGRFRSNLFLLARSLLPSRVLHAKRLLIQCPAQLAPDGTLTHCADCPDATVLHDRLVPICVSDLVHVPAEP